MWAQGGGDDHAQPRRGRRDAGAGILERIAGGQHRHLDATVGAPGLREQNLVGQCFRREDIRRGTGRRQAANRDERRRAPALLQRALQGSHAPTARKHDA